MCWDRFIEAEHPPFQQPQPERAGHTLIATRRSGNPAIAPRPLAVGDIVMRQPMAGRDVAPRGT